MRKLGLLLILFCITSISIAQSSADILGVWLTHDKGAKIEFYKSGDKYYGKLIWGNRVYEADGKTLRKDINNPDASLRSRALLNTIFFKDFIYEDGEYTGGTIYDSDSGKTYSGIIAVKDKKLHLTGYIGFTWLGKTVVWTRP